MGGVIPSHGVVNVSAVNSERTEDGVVRTWKAGRERRMKGMRQVRKQRQGYRGTETDGWRGLVVEGGGRTVRMGGTRARGVNSEEQRRGHGNAQSEVENRSRGEEMGAMQE